MVIKSGVRLNGRTYLPGEEAALAAVLTPQQVAYLISRGAIEGGEAKAVEGLAPIPQSPSPNGKARDHFDADTKAEAAKSIIASREGATIGNTLTAPGDGIEKQGIEVPADGAEREANLETGEVKEIEPTELEGKGEGLSVFDEIGVDIAQLLADGGFDTVDKIRAATDSQLNALPKIGPATVKRIREALK